ncbi:MAG TPA: DUF1761 domain-containing protein [Chloroflexota bacterium]|nr:DUF1761 domain-containing protein [Chloroflexota bacterium]
MGIGMLPQLNWLAVILGTILYFALGAVWYMGFSPTGRIWMRAIGFEGHPEGQRPGGAIYLAPLLAYVLVAVVTGMLARALGVATITDGAYLGFLLWLGFGLPYWTLASVFNPHAKQPGTLILVQSAYHLVGMLILGALFGLLH